MSELTGAQGCDLFARWVNRVRTKHPEQMASVTVRTSAVIPKGYAFLSGPGGCRILELTSSQPDEGALWGEEHGLA